MGASTANIIVALFIAIAIIVLPLTDIEFVPNLLTGFIGATIFFLAIASPFLGVSAYRKRRLSKLSPEAAEIQRKPKPAKSAFILALSVALHVFFWIAFAMPRDEGGAIGLLFAFIFFPVFGSVAAIIDKLLSHLGIWRKTQFLFKLIALSVITLITSNVLLALVFS